MLGFLSTLVSFLGGIVSMLVNFANDIGHFVSTLWELVTWFIGTFVIFVPQPLAILVGLCVGIMLTRFAISRGLIDD